MRRAEHVRPRARQDVRAKAYGCIQSAKPGVDAIKHRTERVGTAAIGRGIASKIEASVFPVEQSADAQLIVRTVGCECYWSTVRIGAPRSGSQEFGGFGNSRVVWVRVGIGPRDNELKMAPIGVDRRVRVPVQNKGGQSAMLLGDRQGIE